jgi:hypothetical protein
MMCGRGRCAIGSSARSVVSGRWVVAMGSIGS